jgi:hypothetical protein
VKPGAESIFIQKMDTVDQGFLDNEIEIEEVNDINVIDPALDQPVPSKFQPCNKQSSGPAIRVADEDEQRAEPSGLIPDLDVEFDD